MKKIISAHYAKIGKKGGSASTPAKRIAARLNVMKRWHGTSPTVGVLPVTQLHDCVWYRGTGRNSNFGLWDSRAECFWTIAVNDFANPATYPANARRQVRLKREDYFSK